MTITSHAVAPVVSAPMAPGLSSAGGARHFQVVPVADFNFAVGFSRQPLPKGNSSIAVHNVDGPRIMATDASTQHGHELAKLRPETLVARMVELSPTANSFTGRPRQGPRRYSHAEGARVGRKTITNGVKQTMPGLWPLGGGVGASRKKKVLTPVVTAAV
jgi:hypothetical protein